MAYDLGTILEGIELVPANTDQILTALAPVLTERCNNLQKKGESDFCIVWKAEEGLTSSGMMYRRNMVRDYFGEEMGLGLEQMIDDADHTTQIVVAMIFGSKAMGFTISKHVSPI